MQGVQCCCCHWLHCLSDGVVLSPSTDSGPPVADDTVERTTGFAHVINTLTTDSIQWKETTTTLDTLHFCISYFQCCCEWPALICVLRTPEYDVAVYCLHVDVYYCISLYATCKRPHGHLLFIINKWHLHIAVMTSQHTAECSCTRHSH